MISHRSRQSPGSLAGGPEIEWGFQPSSHCRRQGLDEVQMWVQHFFARL